MNMQALQIYMQHRLRDRKERIKETKNFENPMVELI